LDRVGEIENEIKQDFTHHGPFRVKRLAKESGQKPEAKKSLKSGNVNNNTAQSITSAPRAGIGAAFTFGAVSPIAPVATFPTRGFLPPFGLLQNAIGGITQGFTGRLLTSTPQKQVDFLKPERPLFKNKSQGFL